MAVLVSPTYRNANEFATTLRHEGIRIGEIIAYRAWRVIGPHWWWQGDDRLHSVLMQDYVWHPDEPASGLILAPDPFPPECPANVFLGALQADQPNPLARRSVLKFRRV